MILRKLAAVLAIALVAGCQKKNNVTPGTPLVNITVEAPTDAQVFHNGDTVFINVRVASEGELHGYEVKITDTATGSVLYRNEEHTHADKFDIRERWVAAVANLTNAVVSVAVSADHNGGVAGKEVDIVLVP